ncbi:ferric reductase-like transmembrane domain-containing protein [Reyranella sp.]|uniref:sulfite oxidase heme-binding subunit YedZ n=1 Tax=Reyranella sp. TaxID=1929291 RepID=UPI00120D0E2B|nr:ferric reductase-like transmembrane domain-containing protein [Reyranella sp.]TAJ85940.1 MAG: sulfoxide reductase heme-binding subunit YedZ [Reyranella sp.]
MGLSTQQTIFWLRLATLVALCVPAVELVWRWFIGALDPRPVTLATHATGDWAVVLLLVSLAMTPARALFDWMPLIHIRRRIGVAAALYALAHLLIYVLDQKWNLIVVATEIVKRFYLTIGFVALLALMALAVTSTNGWQRRLKRNWKRLHWLVYPAVAVALVHFFIQSKVKIGEAAFAAGLFFWLMLWRVLPVKLRTSFAGLFLLAAAATLSTVVVEATWYGLVNKIDPARVLMANIDLDLVPRPAHKVLAVSLLVIVLVALRRGIAAANRLWTERYIRRTIPTS